MIYHLRLRVYMLSLSRAKKQNASKMNSKFGVQGMIKVKRVYDSPAKEDGFRILVDRLWPRGLTKEKARVDLWLKEIAPSNELRQWYTHDPKKWQQFKSKYTSELKNKKELLVKIRQMEKENGTVTLLFSTKETELNNAVALNDILRKLNS